MDSMLDHGDDGEGLFEDPEDILVNSYEYQITDEPPDTTRRRGSAHAASAYLQHFTYPPWGASSGQEGGSMVPFEEKLEVNVDPYDHGVDVLGAGAASLTSIKRVPTVRVPVNSPGGAAAALRAGAPLASIKKLQAKGAVVKAPLAPRASFVMKTTPAGNTHTSLVPRKASAHDPVAAIKNARDVAKRAISVGQKLRTAAAKAKVQTAPAKKKPPTQVRGAVARTSPAPKKLVAGKRPRVRLTASQLKKIADQAIDAGKKLQKMADKHEHLVKTNTLHAKAMKSPKEMLRGDDATDEACMVLGAYADALGASLPDPNNPGYLMDGSFDPAYGGMDPSNPPDPYSPGYLMDGSIDPAYGAAPTDSGYPGPPDYGFGSPPTVAPPLQPGVDFAPDPGPEGDQSRYWSDPTLPVGTDSPNRPAGCSPLPEGAVICDWSRGTPDWATGSWNHFYGNGNGVAYSAKGWSGGGVSHGPGHMVFYDNGNRMDTVEPDQANTSSGPYVPQLQKFSLRVGWGPLVGNPMTSPGSAMPPHSWTYGLRYDEGGDRWFWFRDKAPAWATAADDQQRLNQAILDYKANVTAAAADAAARAAADQLAQEQAEQLAKQQAAEDAQLQHQMDQEMAQAQHEAELQALADQEAQSQYAAQQDAYYQQQQAQQALDLQAWQTQALTQAQIDQQAAAQAAQLEMQAAQYEAQLDAMQPPQDDGAAESPEGADVYDDGSSPYAEDEGVDYGTQQSDLDVMKSMLEDDSEVMGDYVPASQRLYQHRHENSTWR